jgi:hypothetical protein
MPATPFILLSFVSCHSFNISLQVSPPTIATRLDFLTCLLLFLAWLHAFLDQLTLRMDVPPRITLLDLNHLPDCIAWRWHLFQSYFFCVIPQAAWGDFCDTLFLGSVFLGV